MSKGQFTLQLCPERWFVRKIFGYCRTHNVRVCLYIAYIACGSASLFIKTLYFFLTVLALSAAATVANIKIRYDAKNHQFAIFGTRVICVFYSITPKKSKLKNFHRNFCLSKKDVFRKRPVQKTGRMGPGLLAKSLYPCGKCSCIEKYN